MAQQKRFGESENCDIGSEIRAHGQVAVGVLLFVSIGFLGVLGQVQVLVRDNNVDQALKALKKKLQREGVFREMKLRRHYEKPSERRAREAAEAVRRARKMERKRIEREGF
jgi:small subunit ribosomal protein S21